MTLIFFKVTGMLESSTANCFQILVHYSLMKKKIKYCMLCVTDMYFKDMMNTICVILYLYMGHLSVCSSCLIRVICYWLFLQKSVFDVCMFCFIFVWRVVLWILKNLQFYNFCVQKVGDGLTIVSSPGIILCGWLASNSVHQITSTPVHVKFWPLYWWWPL